MVKQILEWLNPFWTKLESLSGTLWEDLECLHPEENFKEVLGKYRLGKLKLCIFVLVLSFLIGLGVHGNAVNSRNLNRDGHVLRDGDAESGPKEVELTVTHGDEGLEKVLLQVYPQSPKEEELQKYFADFQKEWKQLILGENQDLNHVFRDLNLQEHYPGYPFYVTWNSTFPEYLDAWGWVGTVTEPKIVSLQAELRYDTFVKKLETMVTIVPEVVPPEQQFKLDLEKAVSSLEEDSRKEEAFALPGEWQGEKLRWQEKQADYGWLIWGLTPVLLLLISYSGDRDVRTKLLVLQGKMQEEYPELVHKLSLYIGAGLSVRSAFERIAADYDRRLQQEPSLDKPGARAVSRMCKRMRAGLSEYTAYIQFGKETGLREYVRLGTLLTQNMKKGNNQLLLRLREESERISQEQLLRKRKLGEQAGTKMLFPMTLLLAIIMIMIMLPAFAGV